MSRRTMLAVAALLLTAPLLLQARQQAAPEGFTSIFNGKDLTGWKIPAGDNGHWKVVDGVIDYDAESQAAQDKALWSDKEYGNFALRLEWRLKDTPYINPNVPIIKPDGTHKKGADGKEIKTSVPDADSGVYLRGMGKAQVNIWNWPIGSGEVYGYRMDPEMPASVRASVTPTKNADRNVGEWNAFEIRVEGSHLSVALNGTTVIDKAELPGLPPRGRIALQHHGSKGPDGKWNSPPSLVQFRNIYIRDLP